MELTPIALAPLQRFWRSLPLVDRRESVLQLNELESRLPRPGFRWCGSIQPRARQVLFDDETISAFEFEQAWIDQRVAVRKQACEQAARTIQREVTLWLYRPDGPMPRRCARQLHDTGMLL